MFALALTSIVCLFWLAVFRKLHKAGLLSALFLFVFFTYGQLYDLLRAQKTVGSVLGRHRNLGLIIGILFLVGLVWVIRTRLDLRPLTQILNIVVSGLVIITLFQLAFRTYTNSQQPGLTQEEKPANTSAIQTTGGNNVGDIYYILIDGYDRQDWLKQDIHLDNQDFISSLEKSGFIIPSCTQSNYNSTIFSMAATFNMDYLDQLGFTDRQLAEIFVFGGPSNLGKVLSENRVMNQFKQYGYKIINYKTTFPFLDFPSSDEVIDSEANTGSLQRIDALNFQYLFLKTTLLRILVDEIESSPESFQNLPLDIQPLLAYQSGKVTKGDYQKYQQMLYQLDSLELIGRQPGKKFIYLHLLVTYAPFVVTPSGGFRLETVELKEGYADFDPIC